MIDKSILVYMENKHETMGWNLHGLGWRKDSMTDSDGRKRP